MSLRTPDPLYAFREVLGTRLPLSFHVAGYETWGAQKEIKIADDSYSTTATLDTNSTSGTQCVLVCVVQTIDTSTDILL